MTPHRFIPWTGIIFTTSSCETLIAGEEKEVATGDLVMVTAGTRGK